MLFQTAGMPDDPQKSNIPSDDIDLIALAARCLQFFKKHKWIYLVAIVLGITTGIVAYKLLPKIYSSSAVFHSFYLTNQEHIRITENWGRLLSKNEYGELANELGCPESILPKLKKIKAEEIQKVFTGVNPHGFTISVDITDNAILVDLQKGFVYGFENNVYVKQRLDSRKANLKALIDETGKELESLDSTKKITERIIAGKSNTSSLIIDIAGPTRQSIEINEKLLAYKDELKFTKAVQVLQGFSKFRKPTNPKLIPWLVIGLIMFLSLAFVYTFLRSLNAKLKRHFARNGKN